MALPAALVLPPIGMFSLSVFLLLSVEFLRHVLVGLDVRASSLMFFLLFCLSSIVLGWRVVCDLRCSGISVLHSASALDKSSAAAGHDGIWRVRDHECLWCQSLIYFCLGINPLRIYRFLYDGMMSFVLSFLFYDFRSWAVCCVGSFIVLFPCSLFAHVCAAQIALGGLVRTESEILRRRALKYDKNGQKETKRTSQSASAQGTSSIAVAAGTGGQPRKVVVHSSRPSTATSSVPTQAVASQVIDVLKEPRVAQTPSPANSTASSSADTENVDGPASL